MIVVVDVVDGVDVGDVVVVVDDQGVLDCPGVVNGCGLVVSGPPLVVSGVPDGGAGGRDDPPPLTRPPRDVVPPEDEPATIRDKGFFAAASIAVTTPIAVPNTTTVAMAMFRQRSECPIRRTDDHNASKRPASRRAGPAGPGPGGGGIAEEPVCLKVDGMVWTIAR